MRRLLTSFIALAAMLTTSVEVKAWNAVAFRSTLDNDWTASEYGGNTMEKVNDNEFYIDITTNGDVSFRFYVSNGEQWLIPNNGDGTVATHNTDVWGNSGNSSTNACFKLVPGTYNSFRIHLYHDNVGGDGKHYWRIKAEPKGGGGGGTSDEAYYLISPSINGGQKCEYLKFYPSRNRTKDGYHGETRTLPKHSTTASLTRTAMLFAAHTPTTTSWARLLQNPSTATTPALLATTK